MWNYLFFALAGFLLTARPSKAQNIDRSVLPLARCGGQLRIDRNEWQTVLRFEGVRLCPYLEIQGARQSLELADDGTYRHMHVWHKPWVEQNLDLRVHTASGGIADRYRLTSQADGLLTARPSSPELYLDEKRPKAFVAACKAWIEVLPHTRGLAITLQETGECRQLELVRLNQRELAVHHELEKKATPQQLIIDLPREAISRPTNKVELNWGVARVHFYFRDHRWFFTGQ
jgi:hypothetical protein